MKTIYSLFASLLLLCGTLLSSLQAQVNYGGVTGTVKSTTGATMTDVKIELENVATGTRMTATTDPSGTYRFENVPAGKYRLITTSGRVAAVPSPEFDVTNNRMNVMNVTVAPGPATDVITVVEAPARIMETAQVLTYYNTSTIQHATRSNLADRDGVLSGAYNLGRISAGVTSGGIGEASALAVSGHRPVDNMFHIDGVDNNNYITNNRLAYISNMATNDFTLMENQSSPRFGHLGGGKLNSSVLTGTNKIHGTLYDYFQNRNMNAVEPSWKQAGISDEPRFDQNRLGGSVGLPLWKDKVFFYGSMEYIPFGFTQYQPQQTLAPTAAGYSLLAGIPGISASNLAALRSQLVTTLPATSTATVAGRSIPLAPSLRPLIGFQTSYMGTGSIDVVATERQRVQMRYVHNKIDQGRRTNVEGGAFNPALNSFFPSNSTALVASLSHYFTVNPGITNELRLGYNRWDSTLDSASALFLTSPNFQIASDVNFLSPANFPGAGKSVQDTYQLADTLGVRIGRQNIRLGYDGRRGRLTQYGLTGFRPNYLYSGLQQFLFDQAPSTAQQAFGPGSSFNTDQWSHFVFLQDTWAARPSLTIDVGLSYQYSTIPSAIERLWSTSGATPGSPGVIIGQTPSGVTGGPVVPGSASFSTGANTGFFAGSTLGRPSSETLALAPKVGLAWAPANHGFVIRAGFGAQWDTLQLAQMNPLQFPFSFTALGNPSAPGAFLASGGLQNPYANLTSFNLTTGQAAALDSTILGAGQRLPYYMRWNFGVQQTLWKGLVLDASYLGTKGTNLPWSTNLNPLATASTNLPLFTAAPTQAQLNALPVTLTQLLAGSGGSLAGNPLYTTSYTGNSTYHAVAARLSQRFVRGFQLAANYTYSHMIDDSSGTIVDLANPTRQRQSSLFDRRHSANAAVLWDVAGAFKDTQSVARNIIANLTISAIYTYETPQRLPILGSIFGNSFATPALVNPGGAGSGTGIPTPLTNSAGQVVGYLANPNSSFVSSALGLYGAGNRGYTFPLDVTNNVDFAVAKGFGWHDRWNFEVRGEAYNVFNTAQFIGRSVNSVDFPTILQTPSIMSSGNASFQGFRQVLPANARTLQISLRLLF